MSFEVYTIKNNVNLRLGYTTGTCAALAAKAACEMILSQKIISETSLHTPKGIEVCVSVFDPKFNENESSCYVIKDGGDDIDATDGIRIYARVRKVTLGIKIDGGEGIGRVTRKGLDQPVGNAAINSVPRKMIEEAVNEVSVKHGYSGGFEIIISSPEGVKVAKKTFNEGLGILGGISIIGTSGIVEPMSLQAISDTIWIEMKMLAEDGEDSLVVTPGNYGQTFTSKIIGLDKVSQLKCSNFIGDTLDYGLRLGYKKLLFIGHGGKFVKIAAGIMNTHSSFGDGRMEIITAHASLFTTKLSAKIMECVTIDEAIEVLDSMGLRDVVFESIMKKIEYYLKKRVYGEIEVGAIVFSEKYGTLSIGETGNKLLKEFGGSL